MMLGNRLGKALAGLVVVIGLLSGYVIYSERSARDSADSFCSSVTIGTDAAGIVSRALEAGVDQRHARWFKGRDDQDQLAATFTGATFLSRHICWVTAKDGRVTSKQVVYLD